MAVVAVGLALMASLCAQGAGGARAKGPDSAKARYYYVEGSVALAEGRHAEAYELLKKAVQTDPGYEEANYAYALMRITLRNDTLQSAREVSRSMALMRLFVDTYPEESSEAMNYSFLAAQSGNLKEAVRVAQRTEKIDPKNTSILLHLAQYYSMQQEMDSAIHVLERYERIEGESPDLSLRKLQLMLTKGDTLGLIAESNRLVSKHPVSAEYRLIKGNVYEVLSMPDTSLVCYEEAERLEPDNGQVKLALANYYLQKGDSAEYDRKSSEAILSDNIELEEKLDMTGRYMHNIIADSADYRRVDRIFDGLLRQYPHELKVLELGGQFYSATGNLERAEELFSYAVDLDGDNPDNWSRLAACYYTDDKYAKTLEVCDSALSRLKDEPRGLLLVYSAAATMLDKPELATSIYEKLLRQDLPDASLSDSTSVILRKARALSYDALTRVGDVFSMAADASHKMGNEQLSHLQYETSVSLNPENPLALNNYAYYLAIDGGDLEKAEQMSRKSLELEPDNPTSIDTLAWILYLRGKYEEALKTQEGAIEKATAADNLAAEYWDHLGDIQYKCGEVDKAVESWKKALALDKDNKTIAEKIKHRRL